MEEPSLHILLYQLMHRTIQKSAQLLGRYDLKPGQAGILFILEKYKQMSQKELAARMGVTPPSITVALQKMEKLGYILRENDPEDQRVIRIRTTEKGKSCISRIKEASEELEAVMFRDISPAEILLFKRLLQQMKQNLGENSRTETPGRQTCKMF